MSICDHVFSSFHDYVDGDCIFETTDQLLMITTDSDDITKSPPDHHLIVNKCSNLHGGEAGMRI